MKTKKILCTVMCLLIVISTVTAVLAIEGKQSVESIVTLASSERMIDITNKFPFDFYVVSCNEDVAVIEFLTTDRIIEYPYIGLTKTKTVAEKNSASEYVLEYNKDYSFVYTCSEDGNQIVYNAIIYIDNSTEGVVIKTAVKNIVSETSTRASGTVYESEPNNTLNTADVTYDDRDNYGSISTSGDVDWWKVSFAQAGRANFWLGNIPAGCDYDLSLYNSSGIELDYSVNLQQEPELIQYDVSANTYYYIKIESIVGESSSQYLFRAKNYPNTTNTTWFCQYNSGVGTTWNTTNLTLLYFPNMANCTNFCNSVYKCANTPCYTTSSYSPASNQLESGHINMFGCSMSSMAIIFRNLGATTKNAKYDFRNGTTANQPADPFTLTMANIGWPAITQNITSGNTRYEIPSYTSSYNPTYTNWATASSAFDLDAYKIELSNKQPDEKADIIAYYLEQNPEGILVRVSGAHSLVFTDTTHDVPVSLRSSWPQPYKVTVENEFAVIQQELEQERNSVALATVSATEYDNKFTCYDPGTSNEQKGMGVTYNNSWTAGYYGGIDQVGFIYYFD